MGKIYCTECGTELEDTVKFCSSCGSPVDDSDITPNSNVSVTKSNISKVDSVKTSKKAKKSNNSKYSLTTKIFLAVAGFCIVIFIVGILLIGFGGMNSSNDAVDHSSSEPLSPSFKDTIYGVNFQIPEGYKTFGGKDNQNKGTMTTYDRTYSGPGGNSIDISVSTTKGNFYWDLTQNRDYDDVEKTINGHTGVLKSSGVFSYVVDDKLVVIIGANEQQLKNIIIE